ncbi:MAG TPA: cation:dicarboxylase symporter family transporter [Allosphingosinicella sp.]|jgi:Na+/H+-dicarboxylate symporter
MPNAARILAGLALGLVLGTLGAWLKWPMEGTLAVAGAIGGLWLDALRMTIVPLVVSLIVTGIAGAAATAGAGGLTRRAFTLFALLLFASAVTAALLGPLLLGAWAPPAGAAEALQAGLGAAPAPPPPPAGEWIRSLVPTNVVSAAAEGAIVPLTIFSLLFGLAVSRLPEGSRTQVLDLFQGVADTLLVIVRWVLLLAPIGVAALGFGVGAKLGVGAGAVLAHYVAVQIAVIVLIGLAMYGVAVALGRVKLKDFARAAAPAQAVAFSTQSSLASMPPMLAGAEKLGLKAGVPAVVLPLAVAVFRIAAPSSIVIVVLALARINGVEIGWGTMAVVVAMATLNTLVIAGLPNQITFFAAYAPPALAAGVPIELLPLFLAIDTIPDMFYTVGNVTADMAVTAAVAREEKA